MTPKEQFEDNIAKLQRQVDMKDKLSGKLKEEFERLDAESTKWKEQIKNYQIAIIKLDELTEPQPASTEAEPAPDAEEIK